MSVRVKICGVTRAGDAVRAVELGARWVGVNLWPGSPRHVDLATGRRIAEAVRGRAEVVGVFVDAADDAIRAADAAIGLDRIQLHGDEPATQVAAWSGRAIKAFRGRPAAAEAAPYGGAWAWLVDALEPGLPGGTGKEWSWDVAGLGGPERLFLAGGIRPGNAARAVAAGAWALDVCSGVESAPGIKDPDLLQSLFEEVAGVPA